MLPIAQTIKSIQELFTRAGRPKPTISLPVYSGSSRSFKFKQTLSTLSEHSGSGSTEPDNKSILPSSTLALVSKKDDRLAISSTDTKSALDKAVFEGFLSHLKTWRRSTFDGRYFYDVSALKAWMESKSNETNINLDRLLLAVHTESKGRRTFPLTRKHVLDVKEPSVLVVAILLSSELGHLIDVFWQANIRDSNLTHTSEWIESLREQLQRLNLDEPDDIIGTFQNIIPQFTPVQFSFRMRDHFQSYHILPFSKKERVNEKGGLSSVYKVSVREENFSPHLRDQLRSSRYVDPEFGPVSEALLKPLRMIPDQISSPTQWPLKSIQRADETTLRPRRKLSRNSTKLELRNRSSDTWAPTVVLRLMETQPLICFLNGHSLILTNISSNCLHHPHHMRSLHFGATYSRLQKH